jgi:ABC-type Mn2+/Zn2+ transport system permease subunit
VDRLTPQTAGDGCTVWFTRLVFIALGASVLLFVLGFFDSPYDDGWIAQVIALICFVGIYTLFFYRKK